MYFVDKIKKEYKNEKLTIFVDMDGVITDYNYGKKLDFKNKRPIITNINVLKKLSSLDNIELYILSICIKNYQIDEKNNWLDKYAPFFKKENRIIISKESNTNHSSKELKYNFLNNFINNTNDKVILIDDDNEIIKYVSDNIENIIVYQDSSIID